MHYKKLGNKTQKERLSDNSVLKEEQMKFIEENFSNLPKIEYSECVKLLNLGKNRGPDVTIQIDSLPAEIQWEIFNTVQKHFNYEENVPLSSDSHRLSLSNISYPPDTQHSLKRTSGAKIPQKRKNNNVLSARKRTRLNHDPTEITQTTVDDKRSPKIKQKKRKREINGDSLNHLQKIIYHTKQLETETNQLRQSHAKLLLEKSTFDRKTLEHHDEIQKLKKTFKR
eukprot:UN31043